MCTTSIDAPAPERVVADLNLPVFDREADARQPPDSGRGSETVKKGKPESVEGAKATSFLLGETVFPIPSKLVATIQRETLWTWPSS